VDVAQTKAFMFERLFAADFADTVTLNGVVLTAHALEQGREERPGGISDFIEIEFRLADYISVNYAGDMVDINGVTWHWPVEIRRDAHTRVVRFTRNQRPRP